MNELEQYLAENTSQLLKIENMVARLIDRVNSMDNVGGEKLYGAVDPENDSDELDLNPYAILCKMAAKTH